MMNKEPQVFGLISCRLCFNACVFLFSLVVFCVFSRCFKFTTIYFSCRTADLNISIHIQIPDTVTMKFFENGTEYPEGSVVKLGTQLTMQLEVQNNEDGIT